MRLQPRCQSGAKFLAPQFNSLNQSIDPVRGIALIWVLNHQRRGTQSLHLGA
jgi:hypothetical protein